MKENEDKLDKERVDGRRGRGRAMARDLEWGMVEEEVNHQVSKGSV